MLYKPTDSCQIENLAEVYTKYFGEDKTKGYFVEIGAYDGYTFSNTWDLAENFHWTGLCVEPIHELAVRCRKMHLVNSVCTVECAIAKEDGFGKLWFGDNVIFNGTPIEFPSSTIEDYLLDTVAPWGRKYDLENHRLVSTMTMDNLLSTYFVSVGFDLLVIDVEGAELDVLNGFSWEYWKPKMIIIETTLNVEEIENWFSKTDYKLIQRDVYNSIYIIDDIINSEVNNG